MVNFTTRRPPVDPATRKATDINVFNFTRPHMRALHYSWFCFLTAFTGWFAVAPLLPSIKKDLNLTDDQIGDCNIAAVSSTIIFRVLSGPLCEKFGARRVMSAILIIGAIPTALVSLSQGANSLIAFRFFIGILGASFVPCQFWTTQMFNPNTVGSANAFAAGWGNMGGGVTYLLMPLVFEIFNHFFPDNISWRLSMLVPAFLCFTVGILTYFFSDDCPEGDWYYRDQPDGGYVQFGEKDSKQQPKIKQEIEYNQIPVFIHYLLVFINPNVILMMVMYACCFGVEVAVDNVIGIFLFSTFGISQTSAGLFGSIFGLLNIFSRACGGLVSDFANRKMGVRGRLLTQFLCFLLQGLFLILFKFMSGSFVSAIILMGCFSLFTQACCGTSFGIVPYIDPAAVGIVTGLIGAGGNIGGLIFAAIFKAYSSDLRTGFMIIGLTVITVSLDSKIEYYNRIPKQNCDNISYHILNSLKLRGVQKPLLETFI
ncbi:5414_t:CDS:2 [Cetraspora pellucida]|uniref:Nitrate/nitrite transporter n=1 Tax=Cetraspora pellucida TaxID=1433469 RepID=A0A9N9BSK4_9GLOM|nr:5414_t:CDS:2 [Cetraspora pellucida]